MIVDSSALVSVLLRETGHEVVEAALVGATQLGVGGPTLVETGMVMTGREGETGRVALERLLAGHRITVVPFGDAHWRGALSAFTRFGKGRHPAGLNFGDCLTYATARIAGRPLLCIGDDFAQTDLDLVPLT